jgi:hypothetical protein
MIYVGNNPKFTWSVIIVKSDIGFSIVLMTINYKFRFDSLGEAFPNKRRQAAELSVVKQQLINVA